MHNMDITGDDHVIFTFGIQSIGMSRFVSQIHQQWPSFSVDFNESDLQMTFSGIQAAFNCEQIVSSREHSSFYFYCTDELRKHHEDHGFTLNDSGIGPFAVFIRKRHNIEFQLKEVSEIQSDRDLSVSLPPAPYLAWLASNEIVEITLVTPTSEQESQFSRKLLSGLIMCIRSV